MGKIHLRDVCGDDREFLFGLVNDEVCRKNSLDPAYISPEEHDRWFKKILRNETQKVYILTDDRHRIGQGRLELEPDSGRCRMSYSIIPERRGCGYGRYLLSMLCILATKKFPQCHMVYGEVLKKNVASQKIFEDLGFVARDKGDHLIYHRDILDIDKQDLDSPDIGYIKGGGNAIE